MRAACKAEARRLGLALALGLLPVLMPAAAQGQAGRPALGEPSPPTAQDQPSPFRFLKPWLERRLGLTKPREAPVPTPPATSPAEQRPGSPADTALTEQSPAADLPGDALPAEPSRQDPPAGLPPAIPSAADVPFEPGRTTAIPSDAIPVDASPAPEQPAAMVDPLAPPPPSAVGEGTPAVGPREILEDRLTRLGGPAEAKRAAARRPPQPLRLGVLAGRRVGARMAALSPLSFSLSQRLRRPVELLPMASYGAMIDAQLQRRIDGGFYSAASYAIAEAQCRCLEPVVAAEAADGTVGYHAIIVARKGSAIGSSADLAGKTVAAGPDDSLGARRMQLAGLLAEGRDPARFAAVVTTQSPEEAVRLVLSGVADAAFAWSSLAGDAALGYSRGTLTGLVASGELDMGQVAVVWRSPPVTHAPLALLAALPEADKRRIKTYMLGLEAAEPAAYDALNPFYPGGYASVGPEDFSGLAALAAQNVDALTLPETTAGLREGPPVD